MRKVRAFLSLMISVGWALGSAPSAVAANLVFDATEQHYLDAYTLVRQAFEDKTQGRNNVAIQKFQTARNYLGEIQSQTPDWHSETVQYLLADCDKQIRLLEKTGVAVPSASQKRVRNLTEEMLYTIQETRRQQAEGGRASRVEEREQDNNSSYRTSNVPSISRELNASAPRRRATIPAYDNDKPQPARRFERPISREENPRKQMLAEKAEALEAGFISQKKETEQWKLQYSILEEKSKEEIRALSSEFAKEKADFESQTAELNKKIEESKISEQEGGKRLKGVDAEKKKQEEILFSVKKELAQNEENIKALTEEKTKQEEQIRKSTQRIEELESALQEAQVIRSKAEEDIKIREGQVSLRMQQELDKKSQELEDQFAENKKQLEEEIKRLQKEVADGKLDTEGAKKQIDVESAKKLVEKEGAVKRLEQKLVALVKDSASQESKIQGLEAQIATFDTEKGDSAKKLAAAEEVLKSKEKEWVAKLKNSEARDEEVGKLKAQLDSLASKNKQLEDNLKKELESKGTAEKSQAKIEQKIAQLEQANQKLNEEKAYFLEEEKKFAAQKKDLEQEVVALQKQQARLEEDLNRVRYEGAQKEGTIRNILVQTEAKSEQVKAENEKTVIGLIESFKQEKAKWRDEIAKLEAQVGGQRKESSITPQLEELKKSLASLQEDNRSLQADKTNLQNQIKSLEGRVSSDDSLSRKEAEAKELSGKLAKKEDEIKSRIAQWEADKNRVGELGKLLENSENEKKDLYVEINRLTETVTQMKVDLKRNEETNNQLREALKAAQKGGAAISAEPVANPVSVVPPTPIESKVLTEEKLERLLEKIREEMQSGKSQDALDFLNQQIQQYPQSDRLHFYKGLIFSRLNQLEKAKESYLAALAINPKSDKAYNNLGNLYSKQGKFADAIENLKKATEINPSLSEAFNNMGIVYSNLGQFDEAIRVFIRATELSPNLVAAYYNLGQVYYQDGKLDAAKASFEKVLTIEPAHVEAKRYLQQITAGVPAKRSTPKIEVVQENEVK